MTRFRIRDMREPEYGPRDVWLSYDIDGDIDLRVGAYYVATLTSDGELMRIGGIVHAGLQVDDEGRIVLADEEDAE